MHEETELLVKAIEGLNKESNYVKDYIFPIASALFTSFLGAGIAFFTLRHQEGVQIEKDKMNSANKWTLKAEEARSSLIAIKGNYHGQLTNDPFQRLSAIPSILFHAEPITENYQELSFIVPSASEGSNNLHKWSQIPLIRAMVSNYNYLLKLWEQRNSINESLKNKLIQHRGDKAYTTLSREEVIKIFGQSNIVILIDLTERVISLTDGLITELDDFLVNFPEYTKTKIQHKRLKRYGSVLTYSNNENKKLIDLMQKTIEVDFTSVEILFGSPAEDIKEGHKTGYE